MRNILSILTAVVIALMFSVSLYAAAAQITVDNNIVKATDVPTDSTLITAFYKNKILSEVKMYKGSGTITADISDGIQNSDMVKMFLRDMEMIRHISASSTAQGGKAIFNFETKTVRLNSGYEMPLNGLGTYSLRGETCIKAVKSALASGVRLIDTASAYGNETEIGQAIREAMRVNSRVVRCL